MSMPFRPSSLVSPNASSLSNVSGENTNVNATKLNTQTEENVPQTDEQPEPPRKTLIEQTANKTMTTNLAHNLANVQLNIGKSKHPPSTGKSARRHHKLHHHIYKHGGGRYSSRKNSQSKQNKRILQESRHLPSDDDGSDEDSKFIKFTKEKIELIDELRQKLEEVEEGDIEAEGNLLDEFFEKEAKIFKPYHSRLNNQHQSELFSLQAIVSSGGDLNAAASLDPPASGSF